MQATDFVVTKDDLEQCRVIERRLPDADALPGEHRAVHAAQDHLRNPQRCRAGLRHGLGGIDGEVHDHLLQLRPVAGHRRKRRREVE